MNEMNTLDASKSPLWHPWLPNTSPDQWLTVVEGEGCWVKDEYGNRYLDACGGVWSTQCGLGNKPIIEAITEQLHTLSFASLMQNRTHPTALKLAKKLVELTPDPLENVFLTNSGSESVDLAIKLARQFWQIQDRPDKHHIVHLDCSFHGSFFGSMSVTGLIGTPPGWSPGVPSMHAIPAPLDAGVPTEEALWQSTQQLEMLAIQSFGNLAAFIVEPIVGSAGVYPFPQAWWDQVRQICQQHEILLIVDEVATGFGRTGTWFACEHYGLHPDILTVSKGISNGYLPLGATLFSKEIGDTFRDHHTPIYHGSSHNGNPVCCAAALATIEELSKGGLVEKAKSSGTYFLNALAKLDSPLVREVRGIGLMLAMSLQQTDGSAPQPLQILAVHKALEENGLLTYRFQEGILLFPALTISETELDFAVEAIANTLAMENILQADPSYV